MAKISEKAGYLKISSKEDREAVAAILFRNDYTVGIARRKKDGKSFEYFVKYEMRDRDMEDGGLETGE